MLEKSNKKGWVSVFKGPAGKFLPGVVQELNNKELAN
jgi:hypothetical protein